MGARNISILSSVTETKKTRDQINLKRPTFTLYVYLEN